MARNLLEYILLVGSEEHVLRCWEGSAQHIEWERVIAAEGSAELVIQVEESVVKLNEKTLTGSLRKK